MKPTAVRLFVKSFCPWCEEAEEWLKEHEIAYERLDVLRDPAAFREMIELTDQELAPCIEVDGDVLADFGVDQLERWLSDRGYDT